MSDHGSDDESDVIDDVMVTKYKMAADVVNNILCELMKLSVPGACIITLCQQGDQRIHEETMKLYKREKSIKKGLAFPTCISVNNIICHYSPIDGEENDIRELKEGDVVKIDLGAHIDGYAAIVGHTFVIGASQEQKVTGRKADVILAANTAADVAMRLLRPDNETNKVSDYITKSTMDYNCRPVEGMQSHSMRRMVYEGEKAIVLNPSDEQRKGIEKSTLAVNDVWDVDILVSTGSGKPREHKARTTVYKKTEILYQLKMKASRQIQSEIAQKFLEYPFNIRGVEDLNKARFGITECLKHDVVQALPVYCEKDDELVAQFRFTVLMMPNGPMRITGIPFDSSLYKSEYKTRDTEVKDILSQSIKNQKKKKPLKPQAQSVGTKIEGKA